MTSTNKGKNSNLQNAISNGSVISVSSANANQMNQIFSHLKKDFIWFSSLTEQTNFCSDNIKSVLGYTSEEMKSFNEKRLTLAVNEDTTRIRVSLNEFLTNLKALEIELGYKLKRKDNKIISVMEKIYAERDEQGEVTNLFGIVSDLTEFKENEERLYETINELQKLNDAKDKFVSRISHDLRSPFTSIIGFAEVLINDPELPENEKNEYLDFILQSSRNLLHIVTQLSEIIKLQTHRTQLEPQRANVSRLVHYSVSSFTAQVVDKGLEIKVNINESIHINADERLFLLLITGLISNAIKFSKEGGKIFISAQEFNEDFIEIVVKDEGVGIPDKNKHKLFNIDQIFFSEGTKGEKGSGLGLLLSKEIVEKHGGSIWLYSGKDEGTEVHFTIPISKNTILIVENNKSTANDIKELITNKFPSFDVMIANDGYEALNQIANRIPSIIVTEHNLPLMTGLQFIEEALKTYKQLKAPMMVLIDSSNDELINSYGKLGVRALLQKPLSMKVMLKKLEEVAGSLQ